MATFCRLLIVVLLFGGVVSGDIQLSDAVFIPVMLEIIESIDQSKNDDE
jgi:hypothetical protein